jgi:uncharacterized membrane protein
MPKPPKAVLPWLYAELTGWVADGLITEASAAQLRQRYGEPPRSPTQTILIVLFAVLGATLLGGGLILILAHNWDDLGRPVRAFLSFCPLIVAQAFTLYAWQKQRTSVAWIESTALFQALMVGAAIALIGQTYHLPSDMRAFTQTWMLLILPLAYLLNSTLAILLYLGLTCLWTGSIWSHLDHSLLWLFIALPLPFYFQLYRKDSLNWRTITCGYVFIITFLINSASLIENHGPTWRLFYPFLFAFFYLLDAVAWNKNEAMGIARPFYVFGAGGVLIYTFVLSWSFHGWYRDAELHSLTWFLYNALPILILAALGLFLLVYARKKARLFDPITALFPIVATTAYWIPDGSAFLINLYGAILGLGCIRRGLQRGQWSVSNAGILLIAALILARFFDSDFSLVQRGLVFMVLGGLFLLVNYLWWRKARPRA